MQCSTVVVVVIVVVTVVVFVVVLGPGCISCLLQDLVPDGGVPMGKGLHGHHLGHP